MQDQQSVQFSLSGVRRRLIRRGRSKSRTRKYVFNAHEKVGWKGMPRKGRKLVKMLMSMWGTCHGSMLKPWKASLREGLCCMYELKLVKMLLSMWGNCYGSMLKYLKGHSLREGLCCMYVQLQSVCRMWLSLRNLVTLCRKAMVYIRSWPLGWSFGYLYTYDTI